MISFSIISTAIGNGKAYQTGYFRLRMKENNADTFVTKGYGKFYVFLSKESGKWKILIDADERVDLSEDQFQSQKDVYALKN